MSVRSVLQIVAIVFALVLLVIVLAFGAVVALAPRSGRPRFSYFGCCNDNERPSLRTKTMKLADA